MRPLVLTLLLLAPTAALAQAPPRPACTAPQYRQFDFWLGEWDVFNPTGQLAGTNSIQRELRDCVLHERWQGSKGGAGESFNTWDAVRRVWRQTWVDDSGNVLLLAGGLRGTAMVLQGASPDTSAAGGEAIQRITWTPLESGDVRQHWEVSKDAGATWSTAFDGRYVRKGKAALKR